MDVSDQVFVVGETKPQFIINMDNIDINNVLTYKPQRRDKTVPLWSVLSSPLSLEYYQFEVLEDEEDISDETYDIETRDCHVCNVAVPITYWREHKDSAGHRACSLIANASLERVRRQMSLSTPTAIITTDAHPSRSYYCSHCSCAVDVTKRNAHEQTDQHTDSVLYNKLMTSLASLYENKDNLKVVCEIIAGDIKAKDNINIITDDNEPENLNNSDTNVKIDNKIDETDQSIGKEKIEINEDDNDKEYIVITTKSQAKVKITVDNYQGYYALEDNGICRVCKMLVTVDKYEHFVDEHHRKIVEADFKDKHCIRQLDNILNHCAICNDIIENIEAHIVCNDQHNELLKQALIEDEKTQKIKDVTTKEMMTENYIQDVPFNDKIYFCRVCNVCILKPILMEHIGTQAHLDNLFPIRGRVKKTIRTEWNIREGFCSLCNAYIKKVGKKSEKVHLKSQGHRYRLWLTEKDDKIHYHMKSGYVDRVFCQICDDMALSRNKHVIDEHINSIGHQTKYKQMLEANYMEIKNDSQISCFICKLVVYVIDDLDHIKSKSHKVCVVEYNRIGIGLVDFKDITKTMNANQQCDNAKFIKALQANRIENYNDLYYDCKLCSKSIKKFEILYHITAKRHTKALMIYNIPINTEKNKREKEGTALDNNNASECAATHETDDTNAKYDVKAIDSEEFKQNNKSSDNAETLKESELKIVLSANEIEEYDEQHYRCKVCNRLVTKSLNIMDHVSSEQHKKYFDESIKGQDDGKTTRKETKLDNKQDIESEAHKIASQIKTTRINDKDVPTDENGETTTNIQNIDDTPDNIAIELPKFKLQKPTKKLHYLFQMANVDNENEVKCLVCQMNLPSDEAVPHRKSKMHKEVYTKLMESNTMFRIKHRCFCECCRVIMKIVEEYTHLMSDKHCFNLIRNTDRMNKEKLKELSFKMFQEDIGAEAVAKKDERNARLSRVNLDDFSNATGDIIDDFKVFSAEEPTYSNIDESSVSISVLDNSSKVSIDTSMSFYSISDVSVEEVKNVTEEKDSKGSDKKDKHRTKTDNTLDSDKTATEMEKAKNIETKTVNQEDLDKEVEYERDISMVNEFIKSIAYLFNDTDNPKEILCKLCHCSVPSRGDHVLEHMDGVKHSKKYETVLLENSFKELADEASETIEKYRCEACGVYVEKADFFDHIKSGNHKMYLTSQPSTSGTQSKKQTEIHKNKIEEDIKMDTNKRSRLITEENVLLQHKLYLLSDNGNNELYCKICDSDLLKADFNNHVNSRYHQTTFDSILLENEVIRIGFKFFCDRCKISLNEGTALDHIYRDNHKVAATKDILANKSIKNSAKTSDKGYLCAICNVVILNIPKMIKLHNEDITHRHNVLKSLKPQETKSTDANETKQESPTDTKTYICKICNVLVPNNPDNIKIHNNGNRHKNNLKKTEKSDGTLKQPYVSKTLPIATSTPSVSNFNKINTKPLSNPQLEIDLYLKKGFCEVCGVTLTKDISNVTKHVTGRAHIENLKSLQLVAKPSPSEYVKNVMGGTKGRNNVTNVTVPSAGKNITYIVNGYCYVCKMTIAKNDSSIQEHVQSKNHIKNAQSFETILKSTTQNFQPKQIKSNPQNLAGVPGPSRNTSEYKHFYLCKVCNIYCLNSPQHITEHFESATHVAKVNNYNSEDLALYFTTIIGPMIMMYQSNYDEATNQLPSVPKSNLVNKYTDQSEALPASNALAYECQICKLKVPNNPRNIREHIEGAKHKTNVENKEADGSKSPSPQVRKENTYTCHICEVTMINDPINIKGHNDSKRHKTNVENKEADGSKSPSPQVRKENTYTCHICEVTMINNPINIKGHNDSKRHKTNVENKEADGSKSPSPQVRKENTYTCHICEVTMINNPINIKGHNDSKRHKTNVEKLKSDNNGIKKEDYIGHDLPNVDKDNKISITNIETKKIQIIDNSNVIETDVAGPSKGHNINIDNTKHSSHNVKSTSVDDITSVDTKNSASNNTSNIVDTNTNIVRNKSANNNDIGNHGPSEVNATVTEHILRKNEAKVSGISVSSTSEVSDTGKKNNSANIDGVGENDRKIEVIEIKTEKDEANIDGNIVNERDVAVIKPSKPLSDEDNKTESTKTDGGFYVCAECERTIPNNQMEIQSHLNSYHHRTKVSETKLKEAEGLLLSTEGHFCDICKVNVPKNSIAIKNHESTERHQKLFDNVLMYNNIKIREDRIYYCELCDLCFNKYSVMSHIAKKKHISLLLSSF